MPTEGQAKYIADKVKISGGAGYIAKTEQGYHVAIETYDNIKKAKNVLKELNGRYCQLRIRKFKIITPIISSYDEQTSVLFKDAFDCFSEVYLSLHILAEGIQNGEIENEKAIKTVREIKAEVIDRRDYFKENVAISYQDINYVRMLASFSALISALDEITTSKNASPNLLCDIRNCYIKILNIHNMLIYEAGNVIN